MEPAVNNDIFSKKLISPDYGAEVNCNMEYLHSTYVPEIYVFTGKFMNHNTSMENRL